MNEKNQTNTSNANTTSATEELKANIKIEVLNGTTDGKILQKVVDKLKKEGYNVSRTGNTTTTSNTIIANKKEVSNKIISDIQEIIGTGTVSNGGDGQTSSKADITIIIGKDYK